MQTVSNTITVNLKNTDLEILFAIKKELQDMYGSSFDPSLSDVLRYCIRHTEIPSRV